MKKPGSDNLDKNIPKKTTKILDNHDRFCRKNFQN